RGDVLAAIERAVAGGVPLSSLIVIEYANEPVREGQFRKLSAFRIGREIVPHFSVNDGQWLVKYGRMDPSIEDLYLEEQRMLEANPYAEHLQKVFDVAGIEYGRADFGLLKGRIQVYEINTNPHIPPPHKHPSATRMQNVRVAWEKYLQALRAIDSPSGPPVWFRRKELDPGILGVMKHDCVEENARLARNREAQHEHDAQLRLIENLQRVKYAVGTDIDFTEGGNGDFYTRKGWCPSEPWGRWTAGAEAIVHLRFKQPPGRDICLTAFIKAFAPPLRAIVHVNGERLASWELKNAAFRKFRAVIPHEKLRAGEAGIRFEIRHPRSPKSLGLSQDARPLGLGFARMRLDWNQGWRRFAPF
ncbi:MAG TPA: hypothetical protein VG733_00345, partial [Chthoniobacteraceae bacterium]|nr:hypothetical protein [Chthoniobacteraceae bacterium]